MSSAPEYEARYGFPASYARLLFVCVAFALASAFIFALPTALQAVELVIFGGGGLALLALGLRATRLAALRVDESGLTLGGSPMNYRTTTQVVPWPELRAVRLSRQREMARLPVVTAVRRGNQEPLSKPVQGWSLDADRLAEALKAFGPRISLTDDR
jgi:hypothetical protein